MFISKAYAQATDAIDASMTSLMSDSSGIVAAAPSAGEAFIWNMGLVLVLVAMFYLLLIRPQQKRFKDHSAMLNALKKGDKVITGGGLIGKIEKLVSDEEVIIDLGAGQKVHALRSTIQSKNDNADLMKNVANDAKKPSAKKSTTKTSDSEKSVTQKSTAKKSTAKKSASKKTVKT